MDIALTFLAALAGGLAGGLGAGLPLTWLARQEGERRAEAEKQLAAQRAALDAALAEFAAAQQGYYLSGHGSSQYARSEQGRKVAAARLAELGIDLGEFGKAREDTDKANGT